MTAHVVFFKPRGIGSIDAPGVGEIRIREAVTVPGTTSATVADGEFVMVYNGESAAVLVAHGSTPDAAATNSTAATSAGLPVGADQTSQPISPTKGSTINIKALP